MFSFGNYLIREFVRQDAFALSSYANNPKIANNLRDAFPYPYTLEDAENYLSKVMDLYPKTVFAIATDSEAIGCIGLMIGQDVHRFTAEIGYWLAEPYWGRGIMSQAVAVVADYGLEQLGLNRIYAEPYQTNAASARVLAKAGFTYEGRLQASVYKNGKILDQLLYAKVRHAL